MKQNTNKFIKPLLIVEKADGELWGRVKIRGNLITDSASTLSALEKNLKYLILEFEEVEVSEFEVSYDLISFFDEHSYLNISDIAKRAGINQALMRQYASGNKFPSQDRVTQIETAIREIGKELSKVRLSRRSREHA
jgi:hypothetical protein